MANAIGGSDDDVVRSPQEVARRALAVFSVVGLALGAPRPEVLDWLRDENLSRELAPSERKFVEAPEPSEKERVHAVWMSERLVVLCWALRLIDELPEPDEQCDTGELQEILPPFADVEVSEFIDRARLRPDRELLDMAETLMNHHWEARNAQLKGAAPKFPVDIEIIQERHHAANWLVGYCGDPWDEVTTDT